MSKGFINNQQYYNNFGFDFVNEFENHNKDSNILFNFTNLEILNIPAFMFPAPDVAILYRVSCDKFK